MTIAIRHLLLIVFMLLGIGACGPHEADTDEVAAVPKPGAYGAYVVFSPDKEVVIAGDSEEGIELRQIVDSLGTYRGVIPRVAFKRHYMDPDPIYVRHYAEWPRKENAVITESFAWFRTTPQFIATNGESGGTVDEVKTTHAAIMEKVLSIYDERALPADR